MTQSKSNYANYLRMGGGQKLKHAKNRCGHAAFEKFNEFPAK